MRIWRERLTPIKEDAHDADRGRIDDGPDVCSPTHTTQRNTTPAGRSKVIEHTRNGAAWTEMAAHPSTRFRRSADADTARAAPAKDRTERASAEARTDTEPVNTRAEQPHTRMPASTPSLTGRQPETQGSRNHSVHVSAVQPTIFKEEVREGYEAD